uniref:RNA-directed DNA polymerase, eukaryota, nucleotide-binding alpha-beta plait domain protein n=1 Tax=Tanacetum cinerariifolium TaxID=118510 RepID=A0A6L2K9Y8_TANCI|nr:RNA-directed DNA polymerase, eukaryota, nucleotide-binding alpha-beta plait domain protein [Tanacetum cinerariifolium]
MERYFSLSLMGKVKKVSSIPNIYSILTKEGFSFVKLTYLGGLWVLIQLDSSVSKEKYLKHVGVGLWFSSLKHDCNSFISYERIVWLSLEGLPVSAWTTNMFSKVALMWGDLVVWEDPEIYSLSCKHLCLKKNIGTIINESFKVILRGKVYWVRANELDAWNPKFLGDNLDSSLFDDESINNDEGRNYEENEQENINEDNEVNRTNGDALRKCILSGPYKPTTVLVQAVAATDDSSAVPEHTTEMWEAIERLQQGESLNIQDVKTKLFWEFGKFTSHDRETMESYYTRFYKLMNEMIRNNLTVATIQKEVNELHAERLARNANPLALVATAQANKDPYYQTSKSHKSYAPSSKPLILTRTHTTTRYKGKEIVKPITPPSETAFKEDSDPEQAQRDKDMQKNLALIAKNAESQKGLKTLRITRKRCCCANKQYDWLGDTDEEIDEQELEAHYSYMAKIQEVPTADSGTDSEPLKQVQNDTGYNVFANDLQQSEQSESISNTCLVETDDSNVILDSPDMCNDDIQNDQKDVESDDKRELKECKTILVETSNTLGESNNVRDSWLVALQNKQTEFEKYKAFNDRTVDYDKLERRLNFRRTSLTGFPAQSIRPSNTIALDSPYLIVFITETSQSRQHESRKSPTESCLMLTLEGFPFVTVNTKEYHSECSSNYHRDNA